MLRPSTAVAAVSVIAALVFLGFYGPDGVPRNSPETSPQSYRIEHGDQIYNDGSSAPTVAFSLLEGGLSPGTTDLGGNLAADPALVDSDGPDNIPGSVDDVVELDAPSPAIDAGDNTLLPLDKFDIDGDGDTSEPFPTDILGAERSFDAIGSGAVVDMGAHERAASQVGVDPPPADPLKPFAFDIPFPNPVSGTSELIFRLPVTEAVEIAIYDVLGRKLMILFDDVARTNQEYRLEVTTARLTSGVYFARLHSRSYRKTATFVVAQ